MGKSSKFFNYWHLAQPDPAMVLARRLTLVFVSSPMCCLVATAAHFVSGLLLFFFLCLMSVLPLKQCQKKKEKLQIWHITTHVEISVPHFMKDSSVFVQLQLICLSFCFSDVKAMTEIEGPGLTATTMKMTETKT